MHQISPPHATPIIHVISDAGPHPYFRTLIEASGLDRRGLVVGSVGPAGPLQHDMSELGVRSFALDATQRTTYPAAVARLARQLRLWRVQVVQTHLVDGSLVGLAAAALARVPVRIFTGHHSHELPYHGHKLLWPDRACARALCTHVIAPSQQVADILVQYTHIDRRKIAVVHHGFDLARLDPSRISGTEVRAELGLGEATVLGAIGRIYELKNYANLIRAFADVHSDGDTRLVIAGRGDAGPLRRLAAELGVGERVMLVGSRSDVPDLLAACDAFVHPAITESFGMVIVEAMAMGKPVLSTPVGIAPEVISSGETGVLADGPSVQQLRTGLQELESLRDFWLDIGAAARVRVSAFTAAAMAASYEELYARWLADANGCMRNADR